MPRTTRRGHRGVRDFRCPKGEFVARLTMLANCGLFGRRFLFLRRGRCGSHADDPAGFRVHDDLLDVGSVRTGNINHPGQRPTLLFQFRALDSARPDFSQRNPFGIGTADGWFGGEGTTHNAQHRRHSNCERLSGNHGVSSLRRVELTCPTLDGATRSLMPTQTFLGEFTLRMLARCIAGADPARMSRRILALAVPLLVDSRRDGGHKRATVA